MTTNPAAFAEAFTQVVDLYRRAAEENSEALMAQAGYRFAYLCTLSDEPRDSLLVKVRDAAAAMVVASTESTVNN